MSQLLRRLSSPFVKLLRRTYYRSFYGSDGSLARRLGDWVEQWEKTSGRGDVPLDAAAWEAQYRRGDWDFLQGSDELARYGVVATYLFHRGYAGRVLDVGCGEGILASVWAPMGGQRFVGIDVSDVAIERARRRFADAVPAAGAELRFEAADAESWQPAPEWQEGFDAIVFNESVYYFRQPLESVRRYLQWLRPGGVLVVSMFETLRSTAIARRLREEYQVLDQLWIEGPKGKWSVQVLQPRSR